MSEVVSSSVIKAMILFHGAGSDRDYSTLTAIEQELDIPVARVDFPYRRKGPGRRPPDRMPKLVEAVREATELWCNQWSIDPKQVVVGGHSMGGRAASMAVGESMVAGGLAWFSYPLHPQGRPESLRVDHFGALDLPVLLIQGIKDRLGSPDEFESHLPAIPGPKTVHWLSGGHDLRRHDQQIAILVREWLEHWPSTHLGHLS